MSKPRPLFAALILIVAIAGVAEADGRMIVPVVGSTAGVNGANFRTEVQLHNPGTGVMRGSLVFLPQAAAPQAGELATLGYEIGPKQTIRYADVLATMGATGLGSLDVLPLEGGRPRAVVRAFDDQGNFGTRGLMIPVLEESDAPVIGYRFVLVAPADVARYRFNIGVRTLGEESATFRVVERDASGASVGEPIRLEYAGETFRQQPAEMLLGRKPIAAHTYSFEALTGSAFVYATTVDNQTNDGALQLDRPVNRAPVVAGQTVTTEKNKPVTIDVSATDPDDDPVTWAIVSGPSHGTLSDITVGTKTVPAVEASLVYTPATDYQGPDMFTLLVSDDVNGRTFADIVINVGTQTGEAPTAVNDRYTMDEGTRLTVPAPGVLANDTDPEGNALVAQLVQGPVGAATFTLNADGSFTYRPRIGYFGADFFQYTASDGGSVSNVARVSIIVNSTNLPPVAVADFAGTTEDAAIGIAVLGNDSDPDGVTLTIQSVNTAGTLGAVTIGAGGIINYNPTGSAVLQALAAGATLDDTFTYTISDSRGETATATVTVTVTGVDDVPLAVADAATLLEDATATAIGVLTNDTDIDGGPMTVTSVTQGTIGAVVITGGGTGLTYQPNADACGADSFTYTLNGGSTATVSVTVTCVNDLPSFAAGGDATVLEDSSPFTASPWATAVSAGPANESGQTLAFTVTNDNNLLFSVQPSVNAAGDLTFTSAANANGSAIVTITLSDNGGTADGGGDTSASQTFNIMVTAVNDVPSFAKGADETVLEDTGLHTVAGWATAMSAGQADESGQTLTFNVTNDNNALFSAQPSVDPITGALTYTLAADAAGVASVSVTLSDDGGTANGGVDTSAAQMFTITVTDVNDGPSFTSGGDATGLEDSGAFTASPWATGVSPGPATEAGQTLTFAVTNDNNALFSVQPAVNASGDLTFTPAANATGSAIVTVTLSDNGGTADGGVDTSASQTFNITVTAVNDVPSFTEGADETVLEDTGLHTVAGWATAMSAGQADESGQTLTFNVTNDSNALFSTQPSVDPLSGTLTYTLAADAAGVASVSVTLSDDGGTANGGVDTSAAQTFTITVTDVNDAPSFAAGGDATVLEDSGAFTASPWATGLSSGPASEVGQTLTFALTNDNNTLFSAQPAVNASGDLTFTPAANANGSAIVTVTLSDNGGTANGGVDTSASQTFSITVTAVNDVPSFTKGPDESVNEDTGLHTVIGWATAISAGPADESGQTLTFNVSNNNNALFSVQPDVDETTGNLTYTLAADQFGLATVTITLSDNGGTANGGVDTSAAQTFTITVANLNDAPTDIALSNTTVAENLAAGAAVGTLSTTDPDVGETFTYSLVAGAGDTGNASFQIVGNALQTNAVLDFEAQSSYSVRVRSTDSGGLSFDEAFTITVTNGNEAPTDIALSNAIVAEAQAAGTGVGNLSTTDPDAGDTFTYTLVAGAGDTGNGSFQIVGGQLQTAAILDFETQSSYSVRVRTTDAGGLFFEEAFTITVTDVNEAPTDIALSNNSVLEAEPSGTAVGNLTTTDADAGDSHTYTLVPGAGDTDNASFQLSGAQLQTAAVLDYNTQSTYTVRVRTTDAGGLFYEEAFTINLIDVNSAPTDIALDNATVAENQAAGTGVGNLTTTDPDAGDTHTYTLVAGVGDSGNASFQISGSQLQTAASLNFEAQPSYSVRIRTTDGGGLFFEEVFTISVTNSNETPTDLALDNATINENMPAATAVGNLSTTDPDTADTFTYTLVAGTGSTDNASFQISGSQLQSASSFDFEAKSSYTVRIRTTDAGGLFYEEAFVITIVNVPEAPLATPDTFDTIGNTLLEVDAASSEPQPKIYFNGNLLANDVDPDTGTNVGLTTALNTATAGAVVTVNSDGTFTYLPPAGHLGATDTFTYDVSDGTLTTTGVVVTIELSERVWYVKNNAAAGGNGRSTLPFDTLVEVQTASLANDYIFVYFGDGTTLGQDAGILLKSGQRLLGEHVGLDVAITAGTFNGVASPTTVSLLTAAAGSRPLIDNTSATAGVDAGVAVDATTAAMTGIVIRGLNIRGNENAIDVTSGATFGFGVTISDNVIRGSGAAEDIDINQASSGASTAIVTTNSWDTAGSHPGNGFDARRTGGTLGLNFSNNTSIVATATGVLIDGTGGGLTITGFADNTVSGNTAGTGISVTNATFDGTAGGAFQQVSGGTTAIGNSGNGVGASGLVMTNASGDLAFTDLDVFADNGAGLSLTGTGAVNTGAGTGTRVTVTASAGVIEAIGGPAVSVNGATVDLQLSSLKSTNTTTTGVSLTNVSDGTTDAVFSAGGASTITTTAGATGPAFNVSGGNGGVSYAGTIVNNGSGRAVLVDSWAGDDAADNMVFSGAIDENGAGILLNANGGSRSITFSGGLDIDTTTGQGFSATNNTNSLGLHITGTNDITSTSATALRITNTTIGTSHVTFRNVSSGNTTAAADPVNGIVIDTTGASGSLRVQGTGSASSGGVIQFTTGAGIVLNSTLHPQFAWMNIHDIGRSGLDGSAVTDFTFNNSTVSNVGTASAGQYEESGLAFNDAGAFTTSSLSGTVSITNNTLNTARRHGIQIENGNGTINSLTISNNSLTSSTSAAASLGHGILVLIQGSAVTTAHLNTATISGNTITFFPSGSGVFVAGGTGTAANATSSTLGANGTPIAISGNLIGGTAGTKMGSNAILASFNGQNGVSNFNISNNGTVGTPLAHFQGIGITVFMGGTVTGSTTVNNNVIASQQTILAGSSGIAVQADDGPAGVGASAANVNFTINGNNISQNEGFGIRAIARASLATADVTIQNNTVAAPTMANRNGIRVDSGSAVGDTTLCLTMTGNTSAGSGVNAGMGIRKQGTIAITNEFGIVGLAPSPTTGANAAAKITADNPAGGGTDAISGDNFVSCTITP